MRQRLFVPAVALFAVAALACESTPTGPTASASSAPAAQVGPTPPPSAPTFQVQMTSSNEVPPISNADFEAHGTGTITLNVTRDGSGNISRATADFTVTLNDFPVDSVIGAHIHSGGAGTNGPPVLDTSVVSGEVPLPSGSGGFTKTGVSVPAALAQAILNNPAAYYLHVHTAVNPAGAVRGQLVRIQ